MLAAFAIALSASRAAREDAGDERDGLEHACRCTIAATASRTASNSARVREQPVGVPRAQLGVDAGREAVVEQRARARVRARGERRASPRSRGAPARRPTGVGVASTSRRRMPRRDARSRSSAVATRRSATMPPRRRAPGRRGSRCRPGGVSTCAGSSSHSHVVSPLRSTSPARRMPRRRDRRRSPSRRPVARPARRGAPLPAGAAPGTSTRPRSRARSASRACSVARGPCRRRRCGRARRPPGTSSAGARGPARGRSRPRSTGANVRRLIDCGDHRR